MYESTVNIEKSNQHLLNYVKARMIPHLNEIDGISTELEDNFRGYFTLACSDTYRFQVRRCLANAVTEALSLGYKNVYIRDLLKIDDGDFYRNVLVNTVCIFDNDYDKQLVSKLVDNTDQTLCLDGYYNFRMSSIKRKWQEISKLVSDNDFILSDKELIVEFMQYLLESLVTKESALSLSFENDDFVLYGKDNRVVGKLQSLAKVTNCEEEAALNVFCLKPNKVTIYYDVKPSNDFCSLMDKLFYTRYVKVG